MMSAVPDKRVDEIRAHALAKLYDDEYEARAVFFTIEEMRLVLSRLSAAEGERDEFKRERNEGINASVELARQRDAALFRIAELETVLRNLVAKLDDLTPDINGAIQMSAIHGAPWPAGRNWVKEMTEARTVLGGKL